MFERGWAGWPYVMFLFGMSIKFSYLNPLLNALTLHDYNCKGIFHA